MSDIEVKRWENGLLKIAVWSIKVRGEYYFFGREIASELDYAEPTKAVQSRIDTSEKKTMEEILGVNSRAILEQALLKSTLGKMPRVDFIQKIKGNQKLITEFALYHFCGTSKKEKAKSFQKWIFETIKEIRKTGSYTLPGGPIENPLDLIAKVSTFEKEIKTLRKEIHTLKDQKAKSHRGRQTSKNIKTIKDNLKELKQGIEKIENELEKSLKELKQGIEKIENELEKSLKENDSSDSDSSTPRYYSSDSE